MMLTAQPVDAQKAFAWGLVTAVADEGKLIEAAREMAEQIVALPPNALRGTKQLLRGAEDRNLDQELAAAAQMQATLHLQPDHLEAISAVLEKRRGNFSGRSEEHTSELQSLMRISYAVFCLKKKKNKNKI